MATIRKRSKIAKRSVGGVRSVIVKELNGIYTISVPDRAETGNYWQKLKDVPESDVTALIECVTELWGVK